MAIAIEAPEKTPAPIVTEGAASATPWRRYRGWPADSYARFNTLARLASPKPPAPGATQKMAAPITGDPEKGFALAADRRRGGGCFGCHVMGPGSVPLPGNVGPDLSVIGAAGRTDEYLYNYVYDARVFNPDTIMPPWGAHDVFTEEELMDIVAFLKSLRKPWEFENPLDDPRRRPVPVEDRDNLDPFINPGLWAIDKAKEVFQRTGPSGKACAACHAKPEAAFKTWAASMPAYEPRMKKVLGVEEFVYRHAAATTGDKPLMQGDENTALAIYLRYLANGAPITVNVTSGGAKQAAARGHELTNRKIGQMNMACVDCHAPEKGGLKWIRGQYLTELKGQVAHFPTWRTGRLEIWDIRRRLQWCNVAIRADELPPEANEYGELELALTSLSNGLPLKVPGIRH